MRGYKWRVDPYDDWRVEYITYDGVYIECMSIYSSNSGNVWLIDMNIEGDCYFSTRNDSFIKEVMLQNYFEDFLNPTLEEIVMFELEFGYQGVMQEGLELLKELVEESSVKQS